MQVLIKAINKTPQIKIDNIIKDIVIVIYITMIIPIKCFTCGKVLADKYEYYTIRVKELKISRSLNTEKVIYLTPDNIKKTPEGQVLDELGLKKMCCRRHMLSHVDIE